MVTLKTYKHIPFVCIMYLLSEKPGFISQVKHQNEICSHFLFQGSIILYDIKNFLSLYKFVAIYNYGCTKANS